MSVYPKTDPDANTCASSGCACHARGRRYPSDLTDKQWALLEPRAGAVMAELTRSSGRPMLHELRALLDAVGYVTRYGVEWRARPADFPPWKAVFALFNRWSARGLPAQLVDMLRERIRVACGRKPLPTAGSIDSQSITDTAATVGAASRGFGRGNHAGGWLCRVGSWACSSVLVGGGDRVGGVGITTARRRGCSPDCQPERSRPMIDPFTVRVPGPLE